MNQVIVVVPVYLPKMRETEVVSFDRTISVLGRHPIALVAPEGLNMDSYFQLAVSKHANLFVERFPQAYFEGIKGYNKLMLSYEFYKRFEKYEYILIAQLDTFIFCDELSLWCQKGYDYVGAPMVGQFTDIVFRENCMKVGNGGLSLRKVAAFLRFFEGKEHVYPLRQIARRIGLWNKPYTRWLVWIIMAFGWRNTPMKVAERYKWNEDCFWSMVLDGTPYELSKPSPRDAMEFAFERFPSELYAITGKLPFGCHAWEKYQYDTFWKKWIG